MYINHIHYSKKGKTTTNTGGTYKDKYNRPTSREHKRGNNKRQNMPMLSETSSSREPPPMVATRCSGKTKLRQRDEECSSNFTCRAAGATENQEISTCPIFKITKCEGSRESLKMKSFLANQMFQTIALTRRAPRDRRARRILNHQTYQKSTKECGVIGRSKSWRKIFQIDLANWQWRNRWSTDLQEEWQSTQVVVGSLLHLLLAKFSKERILFFQVSQLKMLTFSGHREFQMAL